MQANAQKVQRRLANKPRHPAELAADIVERVMLTGSDRYLDTLEPFLSWWQLSLLDVKLFLIACLLVFIALLYWVIHLLIQTTMAVWTRTLKSDQGNHHTMYKKAQ